MVTNKLEAVKALGQALWLDYIRKDLISSGELQKLIIEDGISGITSNPAIFQQAISGSEFYDEEIAKLVQEGLSEKNIYERLSQQDVQAAADLLFPVYQQTNCKDGFVSLEVNPHFANSLEKTLTEARNLWKSLDRPNVLIKIPATEVGLRSIKTLISEGININVTLLFSLARYREVAEAYIEGIEKRLAQGKSVAGIFSVASFFISRIDAMVDPMLEEIIVKGGEAAQLAERILGKVAIASAKMAYQSYEEIFANAAFQQLAQQGANKQRLLWASTGTKNPAYKDVKYLEALIGPETINTLPMSTLEAFYQHGSAKLTLAEDLGEATRILQSLQVLGIDLAEITRKLENEGIEKFNKPFDELMTALAKRRKQA